MISFEIVAVFDVRVVVAGGDDVTGDLVGTSDGASNTPDF